MTELNLKRGHLAVVSELEFKPFTFATLPLSPRAGTVAYITDSNVNTPGDVIAGGSANKVLGGFGGTNWRVIAFID